MTSSESKLSLNARIPRILLLVSAVNRGQPEVGRYLFDCGAVINRDVVATVVRKKELRWFEMLSERGWNVKNDVLPY